MVDQISTVGYTFEPDESGSADDSKVQFDSLMLIIAVSGLGILGNAFALLVICHYKEMRGRRGMVLVINQCAVDLAAAVCAASFNLIRLHYGRRISPFGGLVGEAFCRLHGVPHWGLMASSSYNLLAITTERYLMIRHPLVYKARVSAIQLYVVVGVVWLVGPTYRALFNVPTMSLKDDVRCVSTWLSVDWKRFYGALTALFEFFVPAVIMVSMYSRIVLELRTKVRPGEVQAAPATMQRRNRNVIKTFLVVTVCFIGCWTPNEVYYLLYNMGVEMHTRKIFHEVSFMFVWINVCINPFIYVFQFDEFRKGVRFLFVGKRPPPSDYGGGC